MVVFSSLPKPKMMLVSFACWFACSLFFMDLLAESTSSSQQAPQVEPKSEARPSESPKPVAPSSSQLKQPLESVATEGSGKANGVKVEVRMDSKARSGPGAWARGLLEVSRIVVSWPFVVASLLFYLVFFRSAPSRVAIILKPFRSLKLFGTEFVLSEEAGADAEQAIETYRKQVKRKFDSLVEVHDIRSKLEAVIGELQPLIDKHMKIYDLRCTLHVPDILFADTLYQLLDYYPLGGGRGRAFSSRFGIIGLCWRSRKDQIKGEVPTDQRE